MNERNMMKSRTLAYLAIGCSVLALVMLIDRSSFGLDLFRQITLLETCLRKRPEDGTYFDFRPITGLILNVYLALSSAFATHRFGISGLDVSVDVPWSTAVTWFQSWYFPVVWLRVWDNDFTCGRHANGISGHVLFYVYFGFLFWRHCRHTTSADGSAEVSRTAAVMRIVLEILRVMYTICASLVLFNTYNYGFHSLRQLIIGFFFSIIFTCTAVLWCEYFALGHQSNSKHFSKQENSGVLSMSRRKHIFCHVMANIFCISCFCLLCAANLRPIEYREFALYLFAVFMVIFYPAI